VNSELKGDGFAVRLLGRSGLHYVESGRMMAIDAEMLTGATDLVIYRWSVGRWSDGQFAGDHDKERILKNIEDLLVQSGLKVDFE
jgi:hypothetical protein